MSFSPRKPRMASNTFAAVGVRTLEHPPVGVLRRFRPVPCVVERLNLRLASMPVRRLEQHIVSGFGVERRIEIDQIDAFVGDVFAQHLEIVAIEQLVGHGRPAAFTTKNEPPPAVLQGDSHH